MRGAVQQQQRGVSTTAEGLRGAKQQPHSKASGQKAASGVVVPGGISQHVLPGRNEAGSSSEDTHSYKKPSYFQSGLSAASGPGFVSRLKPPTSIAALLEERMHTHANVLGPSPASLVTAAAQDQTPRFPPSTGQYTGDASDGDQYVRDGSSPTRSDGGLAGLHTPALQQVAVANARGVSSMHTGSHIAAGVSREKEGYFGGSVQNHGTGGTPREEDREDASRANAAMRRDRDTQTHKVPLLACLRV